MGKGHQLEVGNVIEIDGRKYWISDIDGERLGLMPDPDSYGRKPKSNFWPVFWCIALIVVLIKLIL